MAAAASAFVRPDHTFREPLIATVAKRAPDSQDIDPIHFYEVSRCKFRIDLRVMTAPFFSGGREL